MNGSKIFKVILNKGICSDDILVHRYSRFTAQAFICTAILCCFIFSGSVSAESNSQASSITAIKEYRIGAEDVLSISVWKEKELQKEVIVRPDGGISFPFAGDVRAAGRTPSQLQGIITLKVQKFIPDALVTVSIKKLNGLRVYIIGKVKKTGQFSVGRYVDVLQALTLAGGLDPYASEKNIKILRRDETGKEQVFPFNYDKVKDGEKLDQNIMLQNDDVVVVP